LEIVASNRATRDAVRDLQTAVEQASARASGNAGSIEGKIVAVSTAVASQTTAQATQATAAVTAQNTNGAAIVSKLDQVITSIEGIELDPQITVNVEPDPDPTPDPSNDVTASVTVPGSALAPGTLWASVNGLIDDLGFVYSSFSVSAGSGSAALSWSFDVLGFGAVLNLEPYSALLSTIRLIILGVVSLYFLRLIMQTVKGAFTEASV
jgi:hypothetical protein